MDAKTKDMYMYGLAALLVISVLLITAMLVFVKVPENQIDTIKAVLVMLAGGVLGIYTYFFGSSKSSSEKSATLDDILRKLGISSPQVEKAAVSVAPNQPTI